MLRRELLKLPFAGIVAHLGITKEDGLKILSLCKRTHTDETIVIRHGQQIEGKIFIRCKFVIKGAFHIENCEFYDCGILHVGQKGCVIKGCYFQIR